MFRISLHLALVLSFISCKNTGDHSVDGSDEGTDISGHPTHDDSVNDFALVEPIKKAIYYMDEVDVSTYDSIATQYFHEVLDYTDSAAIKLETKISKLQDYVTSDAATSMEKQVAMDEISKLSLELIKYEKSVTGYVFVHTFLNKGDTLSAIIITNAEMTKGEAFPVQKVNDVEPTTYTDNIRKIEQ